MTVEIVEEHEASLAAWCSLPRRPRTVIYLDAHLDLQPVAEARIEALRACESIEALRRLEKKHALCTDEAGIVSLENWLYPAHRLGLIERLVWVVPPHVGATLSERALGQLVQMDGVTLEQLRSFRRVAGGGLEGEALGVPLRLCSLEQLPALSLPADCVVDIDIDYFIALPEDAPWIAPRIVAQSLRQLPIEPPLIVLCRSVSSGFMPLRYRYVADALAAHWSGARDEAAHFDRLFEIDDTLRRGDRASAARDAAAQALRHPDCAASHHLLSLASDDAATVRQAQAVAERLCAAYRPDPLRRACEARHRQLPLELSSVMAWRQELERDPPAAPLAALTWAALGLLYAAFRRLPETRACHEQCTRLGGPHPELSLALARLMLAGGHPAQAEPLLESAARDDKTRTAALQHRAQALGMQGRHEPALAAIDEVCERTPAWSEPLRLRARALQALGRDDEARRAAAQAQALDNAVRQVMLGLRGG